MTKRKTHACTVTYVRAVAYRSAGEADEGHLALQLVPGEGDRLEDVPQLLLDVDWPLKPRQVVRTRERLWKHGALPAQHIGSGGREHVGAGWRYVGTRTERAQF